jgi:hypothetical protein
MRFLESISDAMISRSPDELVGAVLVAAAVAIVVAALYALGRRKSSPSPTFVGGLCFAAGASCMVLAAGYIDYAEPDLSSGSVTVRAARRSWHWGASPSESSVQPQSYRGPGWSSGFHIVVAADLDRDGRLTADEVAQFVRKADSDGDGSVDFRDIDRLIASRFRPPFQPSGLNAAQPNNRRGTLR